MPGWHGYFAGCNHYLTSTYVDLKGSVNLYCPLPQTSMCTRCLVQVGYRWVVCSVWGRVLPLVMAVKWRSRFLYAPGDLKVEKGLDCVCDIFCSLT